MGRQRAPQYEKGDHLTPYLRVANVLDGVIDYSDVLEMNFEPDEQVLFGLKPGDILLNEGQSRELVGRSAIYRGEPGAYCFQNTLIRFRVHSGLDPEFAQTQFASWLPMGAFQLFCRQSTNIAHLGADRLAQMHMAVPPLDEQRAIVRYVKSQTTPIDALVEAKQRVLDLLAEKRKAIIATAVTRGLDPRVKRRDSGMPWLGEIPAHWPMAPLRYLLRLGPKNGISPPQAGSDGALSFSISAVRDGRVTIEGNEKFVDLDNSVASDYYLKSGDILLVRGNGNLSLVGTCGLVETAPNECTYPDILMLMRAGERAVAEFLVAAINSSYVREQIESIAQTTNGTYKLSGEDVRALCIAVPPLDEQRAIVAHIARETAKLDAVRAATERTIALLKERRSALIAAAVTGQLDVGAT